MTETKKRKTESVQDLDAKIQEMEAELADCHGRPLSWDEVTSTTAEEIARKEQRRGVLPRLIQAAKVKRLELEKRNREAEAEAVRAKLEPAYEAFQEREEELLRAKERRDVAGGGVAQGPLVRPGRRRAGQEGRPGVGRAEGGGVTRETATERHERLKRAREAGEKFQKMLRKRLDAGRITLQDLKLERDGPRERASDGE